MPIRGRVDMLASGVRTPIGVSPRRCSSSSRSPAPFRNVAEVLVVLLSIPFALVGAVWLLALLDYRLSAAVWAGLTSVIALAAALYVDARRAATARGAKMCARAAHARRENRRSS